ncbi:hypothetical protein [Congregibacter sp.]|uniref:hypothetical protein n=1 Tax=Congregibacter sp. TaxID=2744308 RepID=UPI00385D4D98
MEKERAAMVEVAKQQAKEQKDVLDRRTSEVVAQVTKRAYQGMDEQVMRIVNTVRTKHYLEASFYAFVGVMVVMTSSWYAAWFSRGQVEADTIWGDIERWNGDHVRECIKAKKSTCNIHIEVPE